MMSLPRISNNNGSRIVVSISCTWLAKHLMQNVCGVLSAQMCYKLMDKQINISWFCFVYNIVVCTSRKRCPECFGQLQ